MLKAINIHSLFGFYNYSLPIINSKNDTPISFITGPNGYGKTTILRIIDYLYNQNYSHLAQILFDRLELLFDDGYILEVQQTRTTEQEDNIDFEGYNNILLNMHFFHESRNDFHERFCWESQQPMLEPVANNFSTYLLSHPIYYIKDNRLYHREESAVRENARQLSVLLNDPQTAQSNDFQKRIRAFQEIVNSYQFTNKELQIDARYGYRFIATNDDRTILPYESLSSGEKHILIMTYDLLFHADDDSLILIDEPELSFHLEWQGVFLNQLDTITQLRTIQCIVCTHSPEIFKYQWNMFIDLFNN